MTEFFRGYTIEDTSEKQVMIEEPENNMELEELEDKEESHVKAFGKVLDKGIYNWTLSHICTHFSSIFTYPLDTISKGCMALDITVMRCYQQISNASGYSFYRGLGTHFMRGTLFSFTLIGLTRLKWYWLQSRRNNNSRYHVLQETH